MTNVDRPGSRPARPGMQFPTGRQRGAGRSGFVRRAALALLVLAPLALSAGCGGGGSNMSVYFDSDPSARFGNLTTYAWLPRATPPPDAEVDSLVRDAVDRELAARGYAAAGRSG